MMTAVFGMRALIPQEIMSDRQVLLHCLHTRYFDCGYGQWVGEGPNNWCSPYIGWQKAYENSPRKLIVNFNETFSREKILGGEAALWSEQVNL